MVMDRTREAKQRLRGLLSRVHELRSELKSAKDEDRGDASVQRIEMLLGQVYRQIREHCGRHNLHLPNDIPNG